MEMLNYAKEALTTKFATFSGRARRREYWLFVLFTAIINSAINFMTLAVKDSTPLTVVISIISIVWGLYTLIPSIAITVRRLHDTNRSGWWYLLAIVFIFAMVIFAALQLDRPNNIFLILTFLCLAGFLAFIVFLFLPGTKGENDYGPDPKAVADAPEANDSQIEIKF